MLCCFNFDAANATFDLMIMKTKKIKLIFFDTAELRRKLKIDLYDLIALMN